MALYRLLRSNKESGPYTLNDLLKLGLKPYDLIWVDGRSAAWRYPSEVAELKEYAPAVEEQPYDRFYKKAPEAEVLATEVSLVSAKQSHEVSINESLPSHREQIAPQKNFLSPNFAEAKPAQTQPFEIKKGEPAKKVIPEIPDHSYQSYKPQPKRQVFVSMPETNAYSPFEQEHYQQYLPKPKPVQEKPVPAEKKQPPVEEKPQSPIDIYESEETKLETKYTQSLDDIKEMYINTLVQRKTKNRRKEILRKYVKPALVPLFLLLSGVAIGFVMTNKKNSPKSTQSVSTVLPQQTTPEQKNANEAIDDKVLPPEEKTSLVLSTETKKKKPINPQTEVSIQSHKQNKKTPLIPRAVVPGKREQQSFIRDNGTMTVAKKNVEVDPATGERKKVVRNNEDYDDPGYDLQKSNSERTVKRETSERSFVQADRKNIWDMVSVKSNTYVRGAFGGIRGLELTVYNRSGFLLDQVSVELQIMKPSEQPLRTDIITFKNISANGAVTVRVPDSQRGIRVDYRITNIESRQWQKSTAGL